MALSASHLKLICLNFKGNKILPVSFLGLNLDLNPRFGNFRSIIAEVSPEAGPGSLRVPVLALVLAPLEPAHGGEPCNKRFL